MSDREPNLDGPTLEPPLEGPVVEPPIVTPPQPGDSNPGFTPKPPLEGEPILVVPQPSTPDQLADTGPFDVISVGIGALVLVYAGVALLGRKATDSGILASLDAHRLRRAALRPEQGGAA
jgi:hypothetical protein